MAAGAPVVATAVGGVPELVLDGETGWLVPPRDDRALADGLLRALGEPGELERRGAAGRRRVEEHFTVDRMVEGTEAVYEELTG
jgi:glycosyltransferase involved in cell wall biosynthesis